MRNTPVGRAVPVAHFVSNHKADTAFAKTYAQHFYPQPGRKSVALEHAGGDVLWTHTGEDAPHLRAMPTPAFLIDGLRTPVGSFRGSLSPVRTDDLAAIPIRALLARHANLDPALITDVILGCANQAGEDNRNVARMASLLAGLPWSVPGETVNRLCASGLSAAVHAARAIGVEEGECFVAGGVEHMTRAPVGDVKVR